MIYKHAAKETVYAGALFRSRLEARWAAFFDLIGWSWLYEPIDLDGWIPDFRVSVGDWSRLVEVKPVDMVDDFCRVLGGPQVQHRRGVVVLGVAPLGILMDESEWDGVYWDDHGGTCFPIGMEMSKRAGVADYAPLIRCRGCGKIAPFCCDDDRHDVSELWSAAGREVRYTHAARGTH